MPRMAALHPEPHQKRSANLVLSELFALITFGNVQILKTKNNGSETGDSASFQEGNRMT